MSTVPEYRDLFSYTTHFDRFDCTANVKMASVYSLPSDEIGNWGSNIEIMLGDL